MRNKRGVTLIILVITVIILLILAGITVSGLVKDNNVISSTNLAKKIQSVETEREYLQKNTVLYQTQGGEKVGEALKTRNLKNSFDWHIIKTEDGNFSEGWNFVDKGDDLTDFGKASHHWLVNYETGEVIMLEEDDYVSMSPGDMLAVKDSIIINIDSSIVDDTLGGTKESLEEQLGEGVTLENFNYNAESGLTTTSFNFDGVDDYIKIKYNETKQKDDLAKNGFTFEFYGIWDGGTSYGPNGKPVNKSNTIAYNYKGLFCYWNGVESNQAEFRFGISNETQINWNAAHHPGCKTPSDWCQRAESRPWNILYNISSKGGFEKGKISYITVTLDTTNSHTVNSQEMETEDGTTSKNNPTYPSTKNGDYYTQRCYVNGQKIYEGDYSKDQWDALVGTEYLNNLNYFCVGRSSMYDDNGYWMYSKMNAYVLRLYSRGLTEKEVMDNYKKSVEYHKKLENLGSK